MSKYTTVLRGIIPEEKLIGFMALCITLMLHNPPLTFLNTGLL